MADRPAEISGPQPEGNRLGSPGPDQGYVLLLASRFKGKLNLAPGESEKDALAGCSAIAMRRSSFYGRGPVIHDLTCALTLWGFIGTAAPGVAELRTKAFAAVAHAHHYMERRAIVDAVPDEVLALSPEAVAALVRDEPARVLAIAEAAVVGQSHDAHV